MFPETEERVDRLEVALERFITQTTAQMGMEIDHIIPQSLGGPPPGEFVEKNAA